MLKLLRGFLVFVVALCAACSAGYGEEIEPVGSVGQELACTYPVGGEGRTDVPAIGAITQFGASFPKMMVVRYTYNSGSWVSNQIQWDPASNASFSGVWSGTLMTKVSFPVCSGVPCMKINDGLPDATTITFANGGVGAPVGTTINMNGGVTDIRAVTTATGNYRGLKFSGIHNGALVSFIRTIPGTGGC